MVDFIPDEIQAVTGGRGGWTYAGAALGVTTQALAVGYHPDTAKVVAYTQNGAIYDAIAASLLGVPSTATPPSGPFVYHRGYLIIPRITIAPGYYKSDGTTGTLGAAPTGNFGGVYKDHFVIANDGGTHKQRVWFSAAGDPTTWDTTFGWWDTTGDVTAIATLPNNILIFHKDSTERLRGTTPPPGSDMVLEPFLPIVGCLDQFSVAYWQNRCIFASAAGIYMTDGLSWVDLTANAQLKTYWQSLMAGYTSSWKIAGGIYRDHYILSINNGSSLVDCLCFSLQGQSAWRFTNLHGSSFLNLTNSSQEKLYMGLHSAGRVTELSSLWSPSASVKQDGDGTNPTPIVETGMYRGYDRLHRRWIESMGKQKWRFGYVDYDLRDAASDNPTAALSYCTDPAGSYTTAGAAIPETTTVSRVRRALNPTQGGATHSQMLGLKFAVTGPYASAKLYTLEGVFEPIDIGSL